jgi:hypothetical protein
MMSAYIANPLVLDRGDDVAAAKAFPIDLRQMSTKNSMSADGHKRTFCWCIRDVRLSVRAKN